MVTIRIKCDISIDSKKRLLNALAITTFKWMPCNSYFDIEVMSAYNDTKGGVHALIDDWLLCVLRDEGIDFTYLCKSLGD